jgi:hypothetical protein
MSFIDQAEKKRPTTRTASRQFRDCRPSFWSFALAFSAVERAKQGASFRPEIVSSKPLLIRVVPARMLVTFASAFFGRVSAIIWPLFAEFLVNFANSCCSRTGETRRFFPFRYRVVKAASYSHRFGLNVDFYRFAEPVCSVFVLCY